MENTSILIKDNNVHVNIPISKSNIDKEARIVSGWATIDNVDQMGDVVTAEASLRAFEGFRGNVREMHDKLKAVGKVVKFRQEEYFDENGAPYTGIWVDVYISKGAEDTWEKVLDGTLTGFSVYGPIDSMGISKQYVPDADRMVRFITKYDLLELSLVDSPGNELCNVLSIQKSADPTGIATGVQIENVFWCETDKMAFIAKSESYPCGYCTEELQAVGWYEVTSENPTAEIKKILESMIPEAKDDATKGGQEMPEDNKEVNAEVTATEDTTEVQEETPEVQAVEETATTEVTEVNEPDLAGIANALDEIKNTLKQTTEAGAEREAALSKVRETVEGVEATVSKQLSDLLERHEKLAGDFTALKDGLGVVEKRLETVEGSTALRKSSDVENEGQELKKQKPTSVWSNKFLPYSFD
jgi:hypothetical protein